MKWNNQQIFGIRKLCACMAVLLLLFASSCRMNKSKSSAKANGNKDSLETDFFQNLTSKYNILHNANLMLDAERNAVFQAADKNYQVRLSVFDEPTANGDPHKMMDSLIQKAYKIVNTKQESKYINDAYFLIGRAYYFKGSYYTAVEFFEKLTKDDRVNQRALKALAYAWKSRALLQINKIEMAGHALDSAFMFIDDDKATRTFVNAAKANHLVRVGQEVKAIPFLEYAIASNKQAIDGYRWKFMLAQLYRDNNEQEKSRLLFQRLANSNVPFDMSFEAGLQAAYLHGNVSASTIAERVKPFRSMLKEGKNDGYQDQILYEIGKLYLDNGDEHQAMNYFQQSLQRSGQNVYQATDTYLTVADYLFEKQLYKKAQLYYDSAATLLPATYTDVNKVRRKLTFMSELTSLYEQNLWQDTLLSLAKLDEAQRLDSIDFFAEKSVSMVKMQETSKKSLAGKRSKKRATSLNPADRQLLQPSAVNSMGTEATGSSAGTFYFNNQDALLLGAAEFKRKWGNRQLKDDWRFVKDDALLVAGAPSAEISSDTVETSLQPVDIDAYTDIYKRRYLDSVPLTTVTFQRRQKIVHDNMIAIGNIYRDYTRDPQDAIHAYELFLERFPNTTAAPEIYYSLFNMYEKVDQTKSMAYKNRLIELYPTSLHALLAKDRYYMDKVNRDKRVFDRAFERLFALYTAGDHVAVIKEANETLQGFSPTDGIAAQIAYLKALAIGRVGRLTDFTFALEQIIDQYATDSLVVPLATENLNFIANNPSMFTHRVNALQDKDKQRMAFVDEPDMTPWPTLYINGDCRTAVAVNTVPQKEDKPEEEALAVSEEPQTTEAERVEIELLLAEELKRGGQAVQAAKADKIVPISLTKKQDHYVSTLADLEEEAAAKLSNQGLQLDASAVSLSAKSDMAQKSQLDGKTIDLGHVKIDFGPNEYRDKKLFPDTATYYFTINVLNPRVNLAPSRYGIGQFNRSRYARIAINHQLKLVNAENQLLFVGPFETFEEVKTYETRILPLLPEIMKVPQEDYNSFVITSEVLGTLTDGIQIKNYHQVYIEQ